MTYAAIVQMLDTIAALLQDYNYPYYKHGEAAEALVDLHNTYCEDCNMSDDYVYLNDEEALYQLLPTDAIQAFYVGRMSSNHYSPTDKWISLDGYGHPVSFANSTLIDRAIYLSDIARWLDDKEEEEQQKLLEELQELASDYNEEKED